MPTFSQNPHLDYWPLGANQLTNGEFVNGSTAGWFVGSGGSNTNSVLSSSLERAPRAKTAGSAQLISTLIANGSGSSKVSSSSKAAFTSTDRIFVESWVKLSNVAGTLGTVTATNALVMYNSSNLYVGLQTQPSKVMVLGNWVRVWSTRLGSELLALQPTATQVSAEVQFAVSSGTAGSSYTMLTGSIAEYITTASPTSIQIVPMGSSTPTTYSLPVTVAEGPVARSIRETLQTLDPSDYIINESP